jgi:hypothetical protein
MQEEFSHSSNNPTIFDSKKWQRNRAETAKLKHREGFNNLRSIIMEWGKREVDSESNETYTLDEKRDINNKPKPPGVPYFIYTYLPNSDFIKIDMSLEGIPDIAIVTPEGITFREKYGVVSTGQDLGQFNEGTDPAFYADLARTRIDQAQKPR